MRKNKRNLTRYKYSRLMVKINRITHLNNRLLNKKKINEEYD